MEESESGVRPEDGDWVIVDRTWADGTAHAHHGGGKCGSRTVKEEGEEEALLKVEFFAPAENWNEALPLGNGRLGAMVFGGVPCDLLQLNDDTLWSGGPKDWNNPRAKETLPAVRDLVFQGHYSQATKLSQEMLGPYCQIYQPLGDLKLDFGEAHSSYDSDSYHRQLDLERSTSSVTYSVGNTTYFREYFISHPHQVLVIRISADKTQSVSVAVTLSSQLQEQSQVINSNQIVVRGHAPGDIVGSKVSGVGMAFTALLEVRVGGANAVLEATGDQTLLVTKADWLVVLLAASTGFDGPFKHPHVTGEEPAEKSVATMKNAGKLSYEQLLEDHVKDYQDLFQRVSLSLHEFDQSERYYQVGESEDADASEVGCCPEVSTISKKYQSTTAVMTGQEQLHFSRSKNLGEGWTGLKRGSESKISTLDRIENFKENQDPHMVTLLFQFGRYLMLASSRPGTFVSNLQGVWNKDLSPAWRCVPHININLPMNYWPSEVCNLSECHLPVFDLLATMAVTGKDTARKNYGASGWVGHHNVDIWGQTAPVAEDPVWALWPVGGAWLSLHMWEHYCFSLDKSFLKERAYPIFRGCAQFLLSWLIEDEKGTLITNPSTSPEHYFISPDTWGAASVSYASAMDLAIIREVFNALIEADQILGDVDSDFTTTLKKALGKLCPVKLTSDGCLLEWGAEFEDPEVHHRHMSHLFGLYPGHTLTRQTTPDLCEAAAKSLIKRGEIGPGWSMAWKIALWARLWNGVHAYSMVVRMFTLISSSQTQESLDGGGLYGNLLNAHPPFQIDGNFGFTAGVAEMLLQSDARSVYLLPALPEAAWPTGKVVGLRARGGLTVSITWAGGILVDARLSFDGPTRPVRNLHYKDRTVEIPSISAPQTYAFDRFLNLRVPVP